MKIEHTPGGWMINEPLDHGYTTWNCHEAPHECGQLNCPGDLNRRKLEMFSELLGALVDAANRLPLHENERLDRYMALASKAKALK